MEFVAFLEDLCDGIRRMLIICRHGLNSHMEVVIELAVCCDFFDSFLFKTIYQTFLYHFQTFFNIISQSFNSKSTFNVIK